MDQSGSMATSLIYGGIMGAILASMPAVETHVVAFNHEEVVDLTEHLHRSGRPAVRRATGRCRRLLEGDLLLRAFHAHARQDAVHPDRRPVRHEPQEKRFVKKMEFLLESGLRAVTLLAISDQGQPSFNADLAEKLTKLGMPCFGCTPDRLPDLLAAVLKGQDLQQFAENVRLS